MYMYIFLTSRILAGLETSQASVTALSYNVPYSAVVAASLRVQRPKGMFFTENLLVQIHLIIEIILVDRPCTMGF